MPPAAHRCAQPLTGLGVALVLLGGALHAAAGPDSAPPMTAAKPQAIATAAPEAVLTPTGRRAADAPKAAPQRGASVDSFADVGRRALASLHYPWQRLGYEVRFAPARPGTLGYTDAGSSTITIYVRPGQSSVELRTTIAHELGHALDFTFGTPERRADYRRVRHLSRASEWFPCYGCPDFSSPAGDFAEVFAYWLAGAGDFRSRLAGPPSAAQLDRLGPLFQVPDYYVSYWAQSGSTRPQAAPTPTPTAEPAPTEAPAPDAQQVVGRLVSPSPRP